MQIKNNSSTINEIVECINKNQRKPDETQDEINEENDVIIVKFISSQAKAITSTQAGISSSHVSIIKRTTGKPVNNKKGGNFDKGLANNNSILNYFGKIQMSKSAENDASNNEDTSKNNNEKQSSPESTYSDIFTLGTARNDVESENDEEKRIKVNLIKNQLYEELLMRANVKSLSRKNLNEFSSNEKLKDSCDENRSNN